MILPIDPEAICLSRVHNQVHDRAASARGLVSNGPLSLPREFLRSYLAWVVLNFFPRGACIAAKGAAHPTFGVPDGGWEPFGEPAVEASKIARWVFGALLTQRYS
jgi:hypothetical protein